MAIEEFESDGVVKFWKREKGYGAVTVDGGLDVWVHFSHVVAPEGGYRELIPGARVACVYEMAQQDSFRARAVRVTAW